MSIKFKLFWIILIIVWAGVGYLLWKATLAAPDLRPDDEGFKFEIIPRSTERTDPADSLD